MISEGIRRYQLADNYSISSQHFARISFQNEWVTIKDGKMTVSKDYTWDGCTPTYYLPLIGWIGTPDGKRNADGIPQTYYASLVHDVLCQFRSEILISKAATVEVFYDLLIDGGFSKQRATIYATVVRWFGPQDWLGK